MRRCFSNLEFFIIWCSGAAPLIDKTPPNQTVYPNGTITWTITGGNNGTLDLDDVVVTDTLPTGLTYVSAEPVPDSVIGNVITWNLASIPAHTPVGFTITLTALAPPATTATFINQVNMTGTDTSPASYSVTDTAEVHVANQPPEVTVTNPNGDELVCNYTTITWTASDPDGDPLTYTVEYSSNGGSTWNTMATGLTTDSYFWNTSALPSGSNYLVRVIASDGELTGQDTSNGTFMIDNTPPTVNWVSPADESFVNNTILLTVIATDNIEVSEVSFKYSSDGGITYNLIDTVIHFDSTYTTNWDTTSVPDGPYKLRATAFDGCNNTTQQVIDIKVDNTPPTVSIISPPDGSTVFAMVDLLISAQDNECLAKVDVYIDGTLVHTELVEDSSVDFIYEWDTTELSEGPHVVTAVATDCGGLTAETRSTYIVDNLPDHYTQILVNGTLEIPALKPDAERIINFEIIPRIETSKLIHSIDGTKAIVSGFIEFNVTYVSTDDEQKVHFAHFIRPFLGYILWPDLPLDADICPVILIEHEQHHLLNPRTIKKDVVLFIGIRIC